LAGCKMGMHLWRCYGNGHLSGCFELWLTD
jgi:hypothetical protein